MAEKIDWRRRSHVVKFRKGLSVKNGRTALISRENDRSNIQTFFSRFCRMPQCLWALRRDEQPHDLWNPATRFIEIGTGRRPLAGLLARAGFVRYLYVVSSERARERLAERYPEVAPHVTAATCRNVVRQNNADVLILGSRSAVSTLRFRNLRHASHVALSGSINVGLLMALAVCLCHMLLGRLGRPQRVSLKGDGCGLWLIVFPVCNRRSPAGARHYVPHDLGLAGLLTRLRDETLRHVVLRWFESLPNLPPGEDIDLLVDDEHLSQVLALVESGPGVLPCDIYSETGLPRSDYGKMAYYPPRLAKQLLDRAVLHRGLCQVPDPKSHLLSLIYHALYHKGPSSGISETAEMLGGLRAAEHPYPQIISDLANRIGEKMTVTRAGLDAFLEANNWRPPRDMLLRLSKRNRWIRESLRRQPDSAQDSGLVVFLVRAEGMRRGGLEKLVPLLEQSGFSIVNTKLLLGNEQRHVTNNIRGGNWGRGPWAISGGPPAAVVVAFDPQPLPLSRKQQTRFPLATNARVLEKGNLRDVFNEGFGPESHCNVLHSSDNGSEAWEYITLAMPEAAVQICRYIESWQAETSDQTPMVQDLTRFGRRTRVELIEYHGQLAVRKRFKLGCERFCRREELAMRELSRMVPQVPRLIEAGPRSVVSTYYDDVLQYQRSSGWLMSVDVARQSIQALRHVYAAGYALIDASIDNVLIDRHEGLKLIDFEFLYRYEQTPKSFAESYDIAGCPRDFSGDLPADGSKNYRTHWQPYIGLSLDSLLNDPAWLQMLKRTVYVAARPHRYWPRRVRFYVRWALAGSSKPANSQRKMLGTVAKSRRAA